MLLCGYTLERIVHDYGIDLLVFTYNQQGEVEIAEIRVQVKATEQIKPHGSGQSFVFRLDRADLLGWLHEALPVIVVVVDIEASRAYWLYVQAYFAKQTGFDVW